MYNSNYPPRHASPCYRQAGMAKATATRKDGGNGIPFGSVTPAPGFPLRGASTPESASKYLKIKELSENGSALPKPPGSPGRRVLHNPGTIRHKNRERFTAPHTRASASARPEKQHFRQCFCPWRTHKSGTTSHTLPPLDHASARPHRTANHVLRFPRNPLTGIA